MGVVRVTQPTLHVGLVSWAGQRDAALKIANALVASADRLTVIYSNPEEQPEEGPGTWIQIANDKFFGPKFKALADHVTEDIFLLIQADADYPDWPALAQACRAAFERDRTLGYWAPEVRVSPFTPEIVRIRALDAARIECTNLDAIVCAFDREVYQTLKQYPFEENNLGWGVDMAAAAAAVLAERRVVMDQSLQVAHPQSRGYEGTEAETQKNQLIATLPARQQAVMRLIENACVHAKAAEKARAQSDLAQTSTRALLKEVTRRLLRRLGRAR